MADIELDFVALESGKKKLAEGRQALESRSEDFLRGISSNLGTMHSDFIEAIIPVVENMRDTITPGIMKESVSFEREYNAFMEMFKQTDSKLGEQIRGAD